MSESNPFLKLRILQIRLVAAGMDNLGAYPLGRSLIVRLRSSSFLRPCVNLLLGYHRVFQSFADAHACSSRYIAAGHEHPDEIRFHTAMSDVVRESDYPVFFCLSRAEGDLHRVFDLGGNI